MDVIVRTKDCDVSERLRDDAVDRVEHATRFFDRLLGVELVFSEEQNPRIPAPATVEITARTRGHHIRATGSAADHRDALEGAVERLERQLRKYKTRLLDRRRKGPAAEPAFTDLLPDQLASRNGWGGEAEEAEETTPRIVRRKQFQLAPMHPEEAALHLELLGHEFYLFTNAATGRENVIYRRRDGDLGLIEPADEQSASEEVVHSERATA